MKFAISQTVSCSLLNANAVSDSHSDVWAKKTIFLIEMQLNLFKVVVINAQAVETQLRTLAPCVCIHLVKAPIFPTPLPFFWQNFNELHFLRVLSSSCKKKIVIFNYGPVFVSGDFPEILRQRNLWHWVSFAAKKMCHDWLRMGKCLKYIDKAWLAKQISLSRCAHIVAEVAERQTRKGHKFAQQFKIYDVWACKNLIYWRIIKDTRTAPCAWVRRVFI